jgi:hypothetical protein
MFFVFLYWLDGTAERYMFVGPAATLDVAHHLIQEDLGRCDENNLSIREQFDAEYRVYEVPEVVHYEPAFFLQHG